MLSHELPPGIAPGFAGYESAVSLSTPRERFEHCARIELAISSLEGWRTTTMPTVQTERAPGVEPDPSDWQSDVQPQTPCAQSPRPEVVASNPPELWTIPLVRPSRLLWLPITRFAADTEHKQGREYLNSTAYLPTSTGIRGHGQNCTGALSDLQSDALLSWLRGRTEETERVERSEHRGSAV